MFRLKINILVSKSFPPLLLPLRCYAAIPSTPTLSKFLFSIVRRSLDYKFLSIIYPDFTHFFKHLI